MLMALGGPLFAAGGQIARGVDYMAKGEVVRGLEAGSPKLVRDALKTWRFSSKGMEDYNGNLMLDKDQFGVWQSLVQGVGFSSGTASRTYEGRRAQKRAETQTRDRRKALMQKWRGATNRPDVWRNEIIPFNKANPEFAITYDAIIRGLMEQARREAQTRAGAFTEKLRIRKIGEAYGG